MCVCACRLTEAIFAQSCSIFSAQIENKQKGTELNSEPLREERVPKTIGNSDVTSLCVLKKKRVFFCFGGYF